MSDCTIRVRDNLWAEVEGTRGAVKVVREALSYRPKGYIFTSAYKNGHWDGYTRLLRRDRSFPAGLVEHVCTALRAVGMELEVEDKRQWPVRGEALFPVDARVSLDTQQRAAVFAAIHAKEGRGVIYHPVGSGKTVIMLELIRGMQEPTIILVHRKDLLYQTAERARTMFGINVGLVGDGRWEEGRPLTVATFQTIRSRLKGYDAEETRDWLRQFTAIHVDECHHVEAATYEAVMQELPNAYYRFGYSATPFRSGDKGTYLRVVGWTGPVIHHLASKEGVSGGRLVPAHVFIIPTPGKRPMDLDYATAYETGITRHDARLSLTVKIALATRKLGATLILVERLEHGEALAQALGVKFLSGSTPGYERNLAWETMRQGGADCLIASVIADEGLDIPNIEYLILGGGGKAPHRQIQRIGRGMRSVEGKANLTVFDFEDRGLYLGKHSRSRRKAYDREAAYVVAEVGAEEIEEWLTN